MIPWRFITNEASLAEALSLSSTTPVMILKHSLTCSISHLAKMRLEDEWAFDDTSLIPFILEVQPNRELSNQIAETMSVIHESPQVLLIVDGACIYDTSHLDITVTDIKEGLSSHVN